MKGSIVQPSRCFTSAKPGPRSGSSGARPSGRSRSLTVHCSRADNRGSLRLYLDSASVYQWEKFGAREVFYGITSNPLILKQDKVPQCNMKVYKILAKQAFDLGYKEIQLQAWGRDQKELLAVASDIAAIDSRVAVKVPSTEAGANVAASLKRQNALVTMTAVFNAGQVVAAQAIGADYAAPYLHLMNDAGKQGFKEVLEMNDISKGVNSSMRILVAAVRYPSDITTLAAQGCDTFTIPPSTADELFNDALTASAVSEIESAAKALGAY